MITDYLHNHQKRELERGLVYCKTDNYLLSQYTVERCLIDHLLDEKNLML